MFGIFRRGATSVARSIRRLGFGGIAMRLNRRTFLLSATLAGGGALLAACGSSNNGGMSGMDHGGATTTAPYDQNFIDMMVTHHQAAIDMARVAQRKGEHAEIKQLANEIVAAQDGEIAKMKGWRKAWYGSDQIPATTTGMMAGRGGMNVDLKQLEGATPFDRAFIDAMIPHHESALQMAKEAQTKAQRQEIKGLAGEIIAAQQKEIDQMKAWRAQWYPG